jgi:methionine-S-sulfoxide reductase
VGYAGGTKTNPTYHSLGDHTESIQIDYDPSRISYEQLLEIFWNSHDPTGRSWSRQYMAAVFYHSAAQKQAAEASRVREAARRGAKVHTQILPATEFTLAEDYHQKYRLRQDPALLKEFRSLYPDLRAFVDSTAAARVNGYLGGQASAAQVEAEIGQLGLSPAGQERLLRAVGARSR